MNLKNSKEAILNQALIIFGKMGFHKTTMADIAEASGRGRRTIYTYFKNKEEIYEAVVEREITSVTHKIIQTIHAIDSAEDKLSSYMAMRMHAIIDLANTFDALRTAFATNYEWVEKIRTTLDNEEQKILTQIIEQGNKDQVFNIDNVETTVRNVMLMTKGVELMLIQENNSETTFSLIENYKHILLKGFLIR